jgi:hypothetical protein
MGTDNRNTPTDNRTKGPDNRDQGTDNIALTVRIRAPTCGLRQVANEREFRSEAVFIEMRLQARRAVQQLLAPDHQ